MVGQAANLSSGKELFPFRLFGNPVQVWRMYLAANFWKLSFEQQKRKIYLRAWVYGSLRAARWAMQMVANAPGDTSGDRISQIQEIAVIHYCNGNDRRSALEVTKELDRNAHTLSQKQCARGAAATLEITALQGNVIDRELLEGAYIYGSLTVRGVKILAELWCAEGRRDERALQLYCAYSRVCRDEGIQLEDGPLAIIQELSKIEEAENEVDFNNRVLLNSRLRLLNPRIQWPSVELGIASLIRGDEERAHAYLDEATERGILTPELNLTLGRLYLDNGQEGKALSCFEAARVGGIAEREILLRFSLAYAQLGDLDTAKVKLLEAARDDSADERIHALSGTIHSMRGEWDAAEDSFSRALKINHNNIEARYGMARCAEADGNYEEAERILNELCGNHPNDKWLLLSLGSVAEAAGKLDEAVEYFRSCLELDTSFLQAQARLGLALLSHEKRVDEAIGHLELVCKSEDATDDVLDALAFSKAHIGEYEKAVEYWGRIKKRDSRINTNLAASLHELACARLESSAFLEALKYWDEIPSSFENDEAVLQGRITAYEGLTICALKESDTQRAKEYIEKALGLCPEDAALRMYRGIKKLMEGSDDSLSDFDAAAETRPLAGALAALQRAVNGDCEGSELREYVGSLGPGDRIFSVAADVMDKKIDSLHEIVKNDISDLNGLPLDGIGWEQSLAVELYKREDYQNALRVSLRRSELHDLDDSIREDIIRLRIACNLKLSAKALEGCDPDMAMNYLDRAEDSIRDM